MFCQKRSSRIFALVLLGAAALAGCAGGADGDDLAGDSLEVRKSELEVKLTLDQIAYAAHEDVMATVTITNVGRGAVKLLRWDLPNADLEDPLFNLAVDGRAVRYVGPHYKRPRPVVADFVMLSPGAKVTRTVDLGAFYDLTQTGDYELRLDSPAPSNTAKAWIEGRAAKGKPNPDPVPGPDPQLSFTNCNTDQMSQIVQARDWARVYSSAARDYLSATPSATPRYTTWFGAFSSAGWTQVRSHFMAIASAFDNAGTVVDCKCKKPYYAYVYPNDPYKIYVCRVFWDANLSGTDSKAGTLIHEMSHFDVVASTDDLAYGKSACMSLADDDPAGARQNADSHEYFAENTPALQ